LAGTWSQAGGSCRTEPAGFWAAKGENGTIISSEVAPVNGKQELVFIGIDMNQETIVGMLDGCLLSEDEISGGEIKWKQFNDPFSPWMLTEDHEAA
jgi:hypothetical protein